MSSWGASFRGHTLRVLAPDGSARELSLDRAELRVGRARDNHLVLDDPCVADYHCRLVDERGVLVVRDRGSRFGTTVNHRRCTEPTRLTEGDRVGVGDHILEVALARPQVDPAQVAARLRHVPALADDDADAALAARLEQAARAWHDLGRPRRLLPGDDRLLPGVALAARRALAPVTTQWLRVAAARRRRRDGLRALGLGAAVGLAAAAPLVATAGSSDPPQVASAPPPLADPRPPPPAPTPPELRDVSHAVIPGETIEQLAAYYRVAPQAIERWNDLPPGARVAPGDVLRIQSFVPAPRRARHHHVVQSGDTWDNLADRFAVSVADLRAANPERGDALEPGERITWDGLDLHGRDAAAPATPDVPGDPGPTLPLPPSPQYDLRCAFNAYATGSTARHLLGAIAGLRAQRIYAGQLVIGDLSREDGGKYGNHMSHQTGHDVDIWLPRRTGYYREDDACQACGTRWCRPTPDEVDWSATWSLVVALQGTGAIEAIFLDRELHDELREAARAAGVAEPDVQRWIPPHGGAGAQVLHAARHTRHIHVRFRPE
jgi:pSer/pThr/pTyr-binding forkhead associated (FHA) protein